MTIKTRYQNSKSNQNYYSLYSPPSLSFFYSRSPEDENTPQDVIDFQHESCFDIERHFTSGSKRKVIIDHPYTSHHDNCLTNPNQTLPIFYITIQIQKLPSLSPSCERSANELSHYIKYPISIFIDYITRYIARQLFGDSVQFLTCRYRDLLEDVLLINITGCWASYLSLDFFHIRASRFWKATTILSIWKQSST